ARRPFCLIYDAVIAIPTLPNIPSSLRFLPGVHQIGSTVVALLEDAAIVVTGSAHPVGYCLEEDCIQPILNVTSKQVLLDRARCCPSAQRRASLASLPPCKFRSLHTKLRAPRGATVGHSV